MKNRLLLCALVLAAGTARADEGMWTFNHFPKAQVKQRYGFEASDSWLDRVRLSSVRFNSGGSGSFVSSEGLVMTNHHVGGDCVAKLGGQGKDLHKNGFYAKSATDEIKCPDLELNIVTGIDDVTAAVKSVEKPGMDDAAINKAHKEKMASLEKECADKTKGRCDVVTLYQGGVYDLYKYKKYTDVRLVFSPEFQIAFFGGDPDNFTYPRFDLDVAFFRVYDEGKAVKPANYLKWSQNGAQTGELVFTSGNPGKTERLNTVAQLELLRDVAYPMTLANMERRRTVLKKYAAGGPEQERQATPYIFGIENGLKAITGRYEGLKDQKLMAKKVADEAALKKQLAASPSGKAAGDVIGAIAAAETKMRGMYKRFALTENNRLDSELFGIARTLVRMTEEKTKPSDKRLREFRDSNLASLELQLFSTAPVYEAMEVAQLTSALERLEKELGKDDAIVKTAFAGKTAAARAKELIEGTKLKDVMVRKSLAAGKAQIDASNDPLIKLAKALDPEARALRQKYEDEVEAVERAKLGVIGRLQFEAAGFKAYPDATFTLRLSYGKVAGYEENGKPVPPMTTVAGLYERSTKAAGKHPWDLPGKWVAAKPKLELSTPMNFVSTNDIIGGNSGSPVVNKAGELVGLVFDGNIQSLPGNFVYDETQNRTVAVHSSVLIESLRKVYDAGALADELKPGKRAER